MVVPLELGSVRGAAADKGCHGAISKADQEIEEKTDASDSVQHEWVAPSAE